jgi:hypothetical protein
MKREVRKDPLTGEEFMPKKISQRFATSQNRIKYNNEKASKTNLERARIDKPLHSNRNILKELLGNKTEVIVHEEFLLGRGYDFHLITYSMSLGGKNIPCVYEFMIITLANQQIKILRNDRY